MKIGSIILAFIACWAMPANAQPAPRGTILQLYSYELKDRPKFEQAYREHLSWHSARKDQLVWYAWTVQSGARRGLFIDGTAGATFAQLDTRPEPGADAADFARTAGPYAIPVNIETWELWKAPSTATALEDLRPSATVDLFLIRTAPGRSDDFERLVASAASLKRRGGLGLGWYRLIRGGDIPSYMIMVPRAKWSDIDAGSASLRQALAAAYALDADRVDAILDLVLAANVETWSYLPRLSLMPGGSVPQ